MPFSDRLKLAWELKQTVFGREFHTLITLHTHKSSGEYLWRILRYCHDGKMFKQ